MSNELISDFELYKLLLEDKKHQESVRDTINYYYIILLSSILAVAPFVDKVPIVAPILGEAQAMQIFLILLSLIGFILSVIWSQNIKRIAFYTKALDQFISELEEKYDKPYLTRIWHDLEKHNAPGRITKHQVIMPNTFKSIFLLTIIYSLYYLLLKS